MGHSPAPPARSKSSQKVAHPSAFRRTPSGEVRTKYYGEKILNLSISLLLVRLIIRVGDKAKEMMMTGHTVGSSSRVKNLFEAATVEEVKERMAQLRPESERQWGKMNPAQMLAHCSATIGMATGKVSPPRILLGRLLGRFVKKSLIVNGTPMRR